MLVLIAAVANRNVIGYQGQMPWGRLPGDLNRFKTLTMGHPVVVGSKTMESIGKVLPGRRMVVLTSQPKKFESFGGNIMVQGLDFIFELAKTTRVYLAGGESVYRQFIHKADIAYITRIHAEFAGDTFFPEFTTPEWSNVNSVNECDGGYDTSFELWARGYEKRYLISSSDPTCIDSQNVELVTSWPR